MKIKTRALMPKNSPMKERIAAVMRKASPQRSKLKRLGKTPPKKVTTIKLINPIMMPKTLTMIIRVAVRVGTKGLNELVDQVFQILLTAARVRCWFAFLEHIGFEFFQTHFTLLDFLPDVRIPRAIALFHKFGEAAVSADRRGNFQPAGKRVHSTHVGVEQIDRLETLAPDLRVEVRAAGGEASNFQHRQHDLSRKINVGGELVGVPTQEQVARVGVDRTERVGCGSDFQLVLHRVAGKGGVIGLEIEFEMVDQVVFA